MWAPQHASWNGGRMDNWMAAHREIDKDAAPYVMGYYTREDLPFHYALADAFTICDQYHSSVMGPTAPNRYYWMSGTIDAARGHGAPTRSAPASASPASSHRGPPVAGWRARSSTTPALRFLERFTGVKEPNISAWRRSTFGDLTSVFRSGQTRTAPPTLPATASARAERRAKTLPPPVMSGTGQRMPVERGYRPNVAGPAG